MKKQKIIRRRPERKEPPGLSSVIPTFATGLAVLLVVSACTSIDDGAGEAAPASAPPAGLAATPPREVAQQIDRADVDAAVEELDGFVHDTMSRTGVPGVAVAVVYQDEVVYARGFGVRKTGEPAEVDTSTMFQLASVSKSLASSVVAAQVGSGRIAWDDPVRTHEPNFAVADPYVTEHATFTDLMSHRSGLPDHGGDLLEDLGYDYDDIVSKLDQYPLTRFRDSYAYSNYGFSVAGMAAAKAEGLTWAELSEQTIYEPLGMANTTSSVDEWLNAANRASTHVLAEPDSTSWRVDDTSNPEAQSPAGGASSSVDDMARWMRMELAGGQFEGRQIVAPEALQFTHQAHAFSHPATIPGARDSFYGTGFTIDTDDEGRVQVAHAGAFALGASTDVTLLPSEGLGIVVLANSAPVGVAETITAQFLDYVKHGTLTVDWAPFIAERFRLMLEHAESPVDYANPLPGADDPQPASSYAGVYASPLYGAAEVVAEGEELVLVLGKDMQLRYPLTHFDSDTFWFHTSGENAVGPTGITFDVTAGASTAFTVEYLDTLGLGTFTRS
ncbi:serine hydrolase [Ilumatobacter nonamiensis]|uniref:serine hydrolase n=1 Tax=Ilumatobacter nonamiensis TaxID=467093 RepID=UPI00058E49F3|nr:serine hydrolase [Ilumatobacter nonamiensis]